MLDPATLSLVDSVLRLGLAGAAILGFILFLRGDMRPGKLVDREIDRIISERDTWMERALASDKRVDRLADAVETALSIKVPD